MYIDGMYLLRHSNANSSCTLSGEGFVTPLPIYTDSLNPIFFAPMMSNYNFSHSDLRKCGNNSWRVNDTNRFDIVLQCDWCIDTQIYSTLEMYFYTPRVLASLNQWFRVILNRCDDYLDGNCWLTGNEVNVYYPAIAANTWTKISYPLNNFDFPIYNSSFNELRISFGRLSTPLTVYFDSVYLMPAGGTTPCPAVPPTVAPTPRPTLKPTPCIPSPATTRHDYRQPPVCPS
jgi:hypothetical protein